MTFQGTARQGACVEVPLVVCQRVLLPQLQLRRYSGIRIFRNTNGCTQPLQTRVVNLLTLTAAYNTACRSSDHCDLGLPVYATSHRFDVKSSTHHMHGWPCSVINGDERERMGFGQISASCTNRRLESASTIRLWQCCSSARPLLLERENR